MAPFGASCMSGQEHSRGDGGSVTSRLRHGWRPVRVSAVKPWVSLALQPYLPYPNGCQARARISKEGVRRWANLTMSGSMFRSDRLDVAIRPGGRAFCVTNDAAGWAEVVAQLSRGAIA